MISKKDSSSTLHNDSATAPHKQGGFLMPERKSNVIFAHNHVHIISKRLQYSDRVLDSRVDIYGLVRLVGGG